MDGMEIKKERLSDNPDLNREIDEVQRKIAVGDTAELERWIKNVPTLVLKADASHLENRYKPGSRLVTYTGVDESGKPIQETYNDGVAEITEDSVILRNIEPLKYPKGHPEEGQKVEGYYDENNAFVPQKGGGAYLYNEYVSDTKWVKENYGIDATSENFVPALKLQPSFMHKISDEKGDVMITSSKGSELHMHGGDYVVFDAKGTKITSRHAIAKEFLSGENATYIPYDQAVEKNTQ